MAHDNTNSAAAALSSYYNSALNATKQTVGDAGNKINIYGVKIENNDSAVMYVQLFNKAAANVTVGTTVADWTIMVPANDGVILPPARVLKHFNVGLVVAATTTRTGSTNPGTAATVDIWFSQR